MVMVCYAQIATIDLNLSPGIIFDTEQTGFGALAWDLKLLRIKETAFFIKLTIYSHMKTDKQGL